MMRTNLTGMGYFDVDVASLILPTFSFINGEGNADTSS